MNKNNFILLALLFFSASVNAGVGDVVNDLQSDFQEAVSNWISPLQAMAQWLLFTIAVISYTWLAGLMLLRGADIQEFFAEFIRMVMFTGFFYWLILEAPTLVGAIVNGWIWIAGQAGGSATPPNVGQIIERGFELAGKIYDSSEWDTLIPFSIVSVIVMVIYGLVAAKAFFVMLELYVVTSAGVILLGFGGNDWTADYAKRYITYTMATGIKLFVLFLIVAAGDTFINSWASSLNYEFFKDTLALLGVVLMILVLVWQIPDTVQAMLSGASIGSAGSTAAAAAKAAVSAVGAATMGTVGAGMAVKEAAALGATQPGNTAVNTAKNLAGSMGSVIGNRVMGDYNASSGSMGGSMAQQMRQQRLGGGGLYGGAAGDNSHVGGTSSGGTGSGGKPATASNSIGGGQAAASGEAAASSDYKSPAADLTKGSSS